MPDKAHHGRVVFELTPGAIEDCSDEMLDCLAGVQLLTLRGECLEIEAAWNDNLASSATLLQPAAHRFAFARAHTNTRRAATIQMRVRPSARGQRLVQNHRYRITRRLWVTYTSVAGISRTTAIYKLHLAAGPDVDHDQDCDAPVS